MPALAQSSDATKAVIRGHFDLLAALVERARFDYHLRDAKVNRPDIRSAREWFDAYPHIPVVPPDRITRKEAMLRIKSGACRLSANQLAYGITRHKVRSYYYDQARYLNSVDIQSWEREVRAKAESKGRP